MLLLLLSLTYYSSAQARGNRLKAINDPSQRIRTSTRSQQRNKGPFSLHLARAVLHPLVVLLPGPRSNSPRADIRQAVASPPLWAPRALQQTAISG